MVEINPNPYFLKYFTMIVAGLIVICVIVSIILIFTLRPIAPSNPIVTTRQIAPSTPIVTTRQKLSLSSRSNYTPATPIVTTRQKLSLSSRSKYKQSTQIVENNFTKEMFDVIFPYAGASAVFTHDGEPFYTYRNFIDSIDYLNKHPNPTLHNFGLTSDNTINMDELAAFLANVSQVTGNPEYTAPYSDKPQEQNYTALEKSKYNAGGLVSIVEGISGNIDPFVQQANHQVKLQLTGEQLNVISPDGLINSMYGYVKVDWFYDMNQPNFGLNIELKGGAVFSDNTQDLAAVSDDGTLWIQKKGATSNSPYPDKNYNNGLDIKTPYPVGNTEYSDNRSYIAMGPYAQYVGRGADQLSYNYNYSKCSLDIFGDFRLVQYPNLIVTTDRINLNKDKFSDLKPSAAYYFGFPGKNPGGDNKLPQNILDTTPSARILAWVTALWFWMMEKRDGLTCHQAMLDSNKYGITMTNYIINNQLGCNPSEWVGKKVAYYKRICKIFNITPIINCPT